MGFDLQTLKKNIPITASSANSLSIILKIGIGLITSKLLVFVGPSGMALVGICEIS
jgi:PST family polysaccharide transporter